MNTKKSNVINANNKRSVFPAEHPCCGCPYTFGSGRPGCIMGAVPGDCAWYFYRRMVGKGKERRSLKEIRSDYQYFNGQKAQIRAKLQKGIEMLSTTIEMKYSE